MAISERLGVSIEVPLPIGGEAELADVVIAGGNDATLIAWEHNNLPAIAQAIPTVAGTVIPPKWPGRRFDVAWAFQRVTPSGTQYAFSQLPMELLAGDDGSAI